MNKFKAFILIVIAVILQSTLFTNFNILGANINIILPLLIALSQILGQNVSTNCALFSGLVEDILFTNIIGARALSYFIITYFISSKRYHISKDLKTGILTTAISSIAHIILVSFIYFIFTRKSFEGVFDLYMIIEVILNCIFYFIFYKLIKKIMYIPTYRF
ncbi:MAG: rod shape-determining protein MreD [Tissierellia bacterium]|nr:rod shape-determining protein MreD [Tissierellia bacterium]